MLIYHHQTCSTLRGNIALAPLVVVEAYRLDVTRRPLNLKGIVALPAQKLSFFAVGYVVILLPETADKLGL